MGLGTIDQVEPSQASIRVCQAPGATYSPTAVQAWAEMHETALSTLEISTLVVSPASGVGTTDHAEPSQDSAIVFSPGPKKRPTAMHAGPGVHETEVR